MSPLKASKRVLPKHSKKEKPSGDHGNKEQKNFALICAVPTGSVECTRPPIDLSKLDQYVKVVCSSSHCSMSTWMHNECFRKFEEQTVNSLSKTARGRGWTDQQRRSNVWVQTMGFPIIYKLCPCNCGMGSVGKDIEYQRVQNERREEKKRKKKKENLKPALNCKPVKLEPNAGERAVQLRSLRSLDLWGTLPPELTNPTPGGEGGWSRTCKLSTVQPQHWVSDTVAGSTLIPGLVLGPKEDIKPKRTKRKKVQQSDQEAVWDVERDEEKEEVEEEEEESGDWDVVIAKGSRSRREAEVCRREAGGKEFKRKPKKAVAPAYQSVPPGRLPHVSLPYVPVTSSIPDFLSKAQLVEEEKLSGTDTSSEIYSSVSKTEVESALSLYSRNSISEDSDGADIFNSDTDEEEGVRTVLDDSTISSLSFQTVDVGPAEGTRTQLEVQQHVLPPSDLLGAASNYWAPPSNCSSSNYCSATSNGWSSTYASAETTPTDNKTLTFEEAETCVPAAVEELVTDPQPPQSNTHPSSAQNFSTAQESGLFRFGKINPSAYVPETTFQQYLTLQTPIQQQSYQRSSILPIYFYQPFHPTHVAESPYQTYQLPSSPHPTHVPESLHQADTPAAKENNSLGAKPKTRQPQRLMKDEGSTRAVPDHREEEVKSREYSMLSDLEEEYVADEEECSLDKDYKMIIKQTEEFRNQFQTELSHSQRKRNRSQSEIGKSNRSRNQSIHLSSTWAPELDTRQVPESSDSLDWVVYPSWDKCRPGFKNWRETTSSSVDHTVPPDGTPSQRRPSYPGELEYTEEELLEGRQGRRGINNMITCLYCRSAYSSTSEFSQHCLTTIHKFRGQVYQSKKKEIEQKRDNMSKKEDVGTSELKLEIQNELTEEYKIKDIETDQEVTRKQGTWTLKKENRNKKVEQNPETEPNHLEYAGTNEEPKLEEGKDRCGTQDVEAGENMNWDHQMKVNEDKSGKYFVLENHNSNDTQAVENNNLAEKDLQLELVTTQVEGVLTTQREEVTINLVEETVETGEINERTKEDIGMLLIDEHQFHTKNKVKKGMSTQETSKDLTADLEKKCTVNRKKLDDLEKKVTITEKSIEINEKYLASNKLCRSKQIPMKETLRLLRLQVAMYKNDVKILMNSDRIDYIKLELAQNANRMAQNANRVVYLKLELAQNASNKEKCHRVKDISLDNSQDQIDWMHIDLSSDDTESSNSDTPSEDESDGEGGVSGNELEWLEKELTSLKDDLPHEVNSLVVSMQQLKEKRMKRRKFRVGDLPIQIPSTPHTHVFKRTLATFQAVITDYQSTDDEDYVLGDRVPSYRPKKKMIGPKDDSNETSDVNLKTSNDCLLEVEANGLHFMKQSKEPSKLSERICLDLIEDFVRDLPISVPTDDFPVLFRAHISTVEDVLNGAQDLCMNNPLSIGLSCDISSYSSEPTEDLTHFSKTSECVVESLATSNSGTNDFIEDLSKIHTHSEELTVNELNNENSMVVENTESSYLSEVVEVGAVCDATVTPEEVAIIDSTKYYNNLDSNTEDSAVSETTEFSKDLAEEFEVDESTICSDNLDFKSKGSAIVKTTQFSNVEAVTTKDTEESQVVDTAKDLSIEDIFESDISSSSSTFDLEVKHISLSDSSTSFSSIEEGSAETFEDFNFDSPAVSLSEVVAKAVELNTKDPHINSLLESHSLNTHLSKQLEEAHGAHSRLLQIHSEQMAVVRAENSKLRAQLDAALRENSILRQQSTRLTENLSLVLLENERSGEQFMGESTVQKGRKHGTKTTYQEKLSSNDGMTVKLENAENGILEECMQRFFESRKEELKREIMTDFFNCKEEFAAELRKDITSSVRSEIRAEQDNLAHDVEEVRADIARVEKLVHINRCGGERRECSRWQMNMKDESTVKQYLTDTESPDSYSSGISLGGYKDDHRESISLEEISESQRAYLWQSQEKQEREVQLSEEEEHSPQEEEHSPQEEDRSPQEEDRRNTSGATVQSPVRSFWTTQDPCSTRSSALGPSSTGTSSILRTSSTGTSSILRTNAEEFRPRYRYYGLDDTAGYIPVNVLSPRLPLYNVESLNSPFDHRLIQPGFLSLYSFVPVQKN